MENITTPSPTTPRRRFWLFPALALGVLAGFLTFGLLAELHRQYRGLLQTGFHWLTFFQALPRLDQSFLQIIFSPPSISTNLDAMAMASSHRDFFLLVVVAGVCFAAILPLLASTVAGYREKQGAAVFFVAFALIGVLSADKPLYYAVMALSLLPAVASCVTLQRKIDGFWATNLHALGSLLGIASALGVFSLLSGEHAIRLLSSDIAREIGNMISQGSKIMPSLVSGISGYLSPSVAADIFRSGLATGAFSYSLLLGLGGSLLSPFAARSAAGNRIKASPFSNWRIPPLVALFLCVLCIVGWFFTGTSQSVFITMFDCFTDILMLYLSIQGFATLLFFSQTFRNPFPVLFGAIAVVLLQTTSILIVIGMMEQVMQLRTRLQISVLATYLAPRERRKKNSNSILFGDEESDEDDPVVIKGQDITSLLESLRGINSADLAEMQKPNVPPDEEDDLSGLDEEEQLKRVEEKMAGLVEKLRDLTPEELIKIGEARAKRDQDEEEQALASAASRPPRNTPNIGAPDNSTPKGEEADDKPRSK